MQGASQKLLPGFSEYWADFAPFVLELIQTCFPLKENLSPTRGWLQYYLVHKMLSRSCKVSMVALRLWLEQSGHLKLRLRMNVVPSVAGDFGCLWISKHP